VRIIFPHYFSIRRGLGCIARFGLIIVRHGFLPEKHMDGSDFGENELNFVEADMLQLIRNHYKRAEDTAKALDDKAQQTITISSLIVGVTSAFNLTQGTLSPERKVFFIVLFIVYAFASGLCIDALFPREWKGEPIEADWEEYKTVVNKTAFDYYDLIIEGYIESIKINAVVIERKTRDVRLSMGAVVLQVLIIFLIIVFST
jgi:hypothetical protein